MRRPITRWLLPAVEALIPKLVAVAEWAGQNGPLISKVAVAVGTFATAIIGANIALGAWRVIAAATTAINAALGTSFLAVQVATGAGIATAIAGVAAYIKLKDTFRDLKPATDNFTGSLNANTVALGQNTYGLTQAQYALATFIGPLGPAEAAQRKLLASIIASRKAAADYRAELEKKRLAELTAAAATKTTETKQEKLKKTIRAAQAEIKKYVASIRDAISSSISLSGAFQQATDQETARTEGINAALEKRKQAYEALNQAKATNDVEGYNRALQDVAESEAAVSSAQAVKPKDYTQIFREQITAAKEFAGYVKQLAAAGLSKAGLAQILDLGPVAGAKVAKDLLTGASGMTVGTLNQDLADVAAAGTAAGMAIPGFEAALRTTVGGTANAPTININAGVGDPAEIGKTVVEVLKSYNARFGDIPVKVKRKGKVGGG